MTWNNGFTHGGSGVPPHIRVDRLDGGESKYGLDYILLNDLESHISYRFI